jgi:hypothetical protein
LLSDYLLHDAEQPRLDQSRARVDPLQVPAELGGFGVLEVIERGKRLGSFQASAAGVLAACDGTDTCPVR